LKIITWNVNGIRAALRKDALDWVLEQGADVICLQEIKAQPHQLEEADRQKWRGYQEIWNPAERPGYSGVLTLTRGHPKRAEKGFGVPEFDREGRVIQTEWDDFVLFNVYFPNGQRDHERLQYKLDFYARLLEYCDRYHEAGKQIIIGGDFNTAHQEIDLRNPKENINTSGFMPVERAWIDRYLEHGFSDVYRLLYPERVQYTWWTYRYGARRRNIGWRLDYFLVSAGLAERVSEVVIHEDVRGSDHCPVTLLVD